MKRYLAFGFIALLSLGLATPTLALEPSRLQGDSHDPHLQLLLEGQYKELDRELTVLQKEYRTNAAAEKQLHEAVYEFYRSDSKVGKALHKWLGVQPNSAMAHLARGVYRTKMGWTNRGTGWASDTTDDQFSGMGAWFEAAGQDFVEALTLEPTLVEAYCYLIEIDMNFGGRQTRQLFETALKIHPSSFVAREYFTHSLLPRWGGSYEAIQKVAADTGSYYARAPHLKVLEGRVSADIASLAAHRGDYKQALGYFDKALANGDFWFFNQGKGEALWELDDYSGALDQFSRVIRDKPGYKRGWWMRSQVQKMLNNFPAAISDISRAIDIEPLDDSPVAARGYIYEMAGDYKSALKDFQVAARLNSKNGQHEASVKRVEAMLAKKKLPR